VPLTLVQEALNESTRPLTDMRRPQFRIGLLPKLLEKLADFHDLHHLEIGSAQRMKETDGLGEIVVLLLGINEFIGIHNLLIVFPFSCGGGSPLIIIDPFPILVKEKFI
jgi:hypothetical protein